MERGRLGAGAWQQAAPACATWPQAALASRVRVLTPQSHTRARKICGHTGQTEGDAQQQGGASHGWRVHCREPLAASAGARQAPTGAMATRGRRLRLAPCLSSPTGSRLVRRSVTPPPGSVATASEAHRGQGHQLAALLGRAVDLDEHQLARHVRHQRQLLNLHRRDSAAARGGGSLWCTECRSSGGSGPLQPRLPCGSTASQHPLLHTAPCTPHPTKTPPRRYKHPAPSTQQAAGGPPPTFSTYTSLFSCLMRLAMPAPLAGTTCRCDGCG